MLRLSDWSITGNTLKTLLKRVVIIGLVCFLFLLSLLASGKWLMVSNTKLNRADVIVVLGYPSEPDGTPSQTMRFRVEKGAELYHQGCAPFIVFSGGAVDQAFIEAKVMASYAITLGVPKDAIILETESRDTLENASLVSAILTSRGWKSIILVTSPYHTRRATKLFERLGYSVTSVVSNSPTETSTRTRLSEILHEYFLWIYYKFVHAI